MPQKYTIRTTNRFEKDLARCKARGLNMNEIRTAITLLASQGWLPKEYKPHKIYGQYEGKWECHIKDDWLMVWEQNNSQLTLLFTNTGSHRDLFGKTRR